MGRRLAFRQGNESPSRHHIVTVNKCKEIVTPIVQEILERDDDIRIVAVDGPGGSGKTTFAATLAAAVSSAPVVRTHDFTSASNPINRWAIH